MQQLKQNESDIENSATIQKRVIAARDLQFTRQQKLNAYLSTKEINNFCPLDDATQNKLDQACNKFKLSIRSYFRIIKVARTIADIKGSEQIQKTHLLQALAYRMQE